MRLAVSICIKQSWREIFQTIVFYIAFEFFYNGAAFVLSCFCSGISFQQELAFKSQSTFALQFLSKETLQKNILKTVLLCNVIDESRIIREIDTYML